MQLISEITESDIWIISQPQENTQYSLRKTARAVVFDDENRIALLYVKNRNCYMLPWWGFEPGESISIALEREIFEETGAHFVTLNEIGMSIEYKNEKRQIQISYFILGKSIGKIQTVNFTEEEISLGFELLWLDIDEAQKRMENCTPDGYHWRFSRYRDLLALREAQQILENIQ